MEYNMLNSGIYKISINDYIYIGYTKDFSYRKSTHFNKLKKNKHHNKYAQNVYNKYQSFTFEIIEKCSEDILIEREKFWIDFHGFPNNDKLLNILEGGIKAPNLSGEKAYWFGKVGPTKGCKSPETSERFRGNKHNLGKKHTYEVRKAKSIKSSKINQNNVYLLSPNKEKVCLGDFVSMREFCAINSLDRSSINRIITGRKNSRGNRTLSYKGWTLWQ